MKICWKHVGSVLEASWKRLGSVLEASWTYLDVRNIGRSNEKHLPVHIVSDNSTYANAYVNIRDRGGILGVK